jgi:hypothetical protein
LARAIDALPFTASTAATTTERASIAS